MNIENPNYLKNETIGKKEVLPSSEKFPMPEEYIQKMREHGYEERAEAYEKVLELAGIIKEAGGRALLLGGSVRDQVMGKIPKDFDLEVYNLPADVVERIIQPIGKVKDVGRAFGILKIRLENGFEIDVSLPRTDSKIGEGHRGFEIKTDPFMSIEDAAKRRDFTMNSMAADPLNGELFDPFGGVEDIKKRVLKVTDEERFKDDPLRVLRAIQFIGRFGMKIDKKSLAIIQEMAPKLREEPMERISEEWKKLLLSSEKPSLGLSAGMTLDVFSEISPEFVALSETEQDPDWHPEGDVWVHTLMAVDEAAKIVQQEELEEEKKLVVMLATLCHDLGKPAVTEEKDGRIKSHGHEKAGEEPTRKFLAKMLINNTLKEKVVQLVANHLIPTTLYITEKKRGIKTKDGAVRRLAERIHPATIQELVLVSEADHLGRGFSDPENREEMLLPTNTFPVRDWLLEKARRLEVESSRPANLIKGREWLNFGFEQGYNIGQLVQLSNALRDEKNYSKEMVFEIVDGVDDSEKAVELLKLHLK